VKRFLLFALTFTSSFSAPISDLAFSPDGSVLVSTASKAVELRSPTDCTVNSRIPVDLPRVAALAFDQHGRLLAIGGGAPSEYGRAAIIDWKSRQIVQTFDHHKDLVTALTISPDGAVIALASADHSASIHSLQRTNSSAIKLAGHSAPVLDIVFSPDGKMILTASADRSIKVWSTEGKLLRSLGNHTEIVHKLAVRITDSGELECASASDDETVRIWQPQTGRMVRIVRGHNEPVYSVAYSGDGTALFSAGKSGVIRRIDVASDEILDEWKAHTEAVYSLAVSPDGKTLATGDWMGNVRSRRIQR
jgi:WD40 repeat protein